MRSSLFYSKPSQMMRPLEGDLVPHAVSAYHGHLTPA